MTNGIVDALLHEREGYRRAGRVDRMRQVDVQLAKFGIAVEDQPRSAPVDDGMTERAVTGPPEKRHPGRPSKT